MATSPFTLEIIEPSTRHIEIDTGTFVDLPDIYLEVTNNSATLVSVPDINAEDIVGLDTYLDEWILEASIDCGSP